MTFGTGGGSTSFGFEAPEMKIQTIDIIQRMRETNFGHVWVFLLLVSLKRQARVGFGLDRVFFLV